MVARITRARVRSLPVSDSTLDSISGLMASVSVMAGHRGAVWLLNRTTGEAAAVDIYDAWEHLDSTRQGDLRDALADALDVEVTSVDEYEVVGIDQLVSP